MTSPSPSDDLGDKLDELIVNSRLLAQSLNDKQDENKDVEHCINPARALINLMLGDCDSVQILMLVCCMVLVGVTSLFAPVNSILIGNIFNTAAQYLKDKNISSDDHLYLNHVTQLVYGLVVLGFANLLIYWVYGFLFLYLGERIACRVRIKLLASLLALPASKLDSFQGVGGIISKSQRFVEDLQLGVSVVISRIASSFGTITVGIIISFYFSWILTLAILSCIPILVAVGFFISPHVRANTLAEKDCNETSSKHVDWTIKNISTVKLFNAQSIELDNFINLLHMGSNYFNRASFFFGIQQGFITSTVLSIFVVGFWLGGYLVHKGSIPLSSVFVVFMNCFTAASNCQLIAPQLVNLEKAKVAAVELTLLINTQSSDNSTNVDTCRNNVIYPSGKCHGDIVFNCVSFCYPSQHRPILHHVSLRFQPNKHTFIIGSSGSGKSTLGSLIHKLYKISKGSITVDGIPIDCLPSQWLAENIMLMQQTSLIIDGSLRFNLEIGSLPGAPPVSQARIDYALQISLLQQFVYDLPDGLDTILGTGGIELSGGQRQRLALARAVIRDPPVLILDEFVSALDITQRELIFEAVRNWRHNKTTIFITHELGQIRSNDFAYILDKGLIRQQGYRRELELDPHGPFVRMASNDCEQQTTTITQKLARKPSIQKKASSSRNSLGPTRLSVSSSFLSFLDHGNHLMGNDDDDDDAWLQDIDEEISTVATVVRPANRRPQRISIGDDEKAHDTDKDVTSIAAITSSFIRSLKSTFTAKKKPQKTGMSNRKIVTLVRATIPSLSMVVFGLGVTIIHGVITPLFSFGFSHLLTSISEPPSHEATQNGIKWSLVILALAITDGLAVCLKTYYLFRGGQAWVSRLQQDAYQSVLLQDMKWFSNDENKSGAANVTRTLISEPEEARKLVSVLCATAPGAFAMVCLGLIWALASGYQLSLVALCMVPVILFNSSRYAVLSQRWNRTTQLAIDSSLSTFHEAVSKYKMVKVLSLDRYFLAKYIGQCRSIRSIGLKHSFYGGFFNGSVPMITTFTQAIILWYAMKLVFEGSYSYQQAMNVLTMILFSLTVAAGIIGQIPQIGRSKGATEKLKNLAFLSRDSKESHGGEKLFFKGGQQVTLDNVSFSYKDGKQDSRNSKNTTSMALSNISFQINPGMALALVGESGSGKSTIASLLSKLQFATRGDIRFGSCQLEDLDTNSLRTYMSTVSQTATLFAGTIFNNIAYGLKGHQQSLSQSQLERLVVEAAQRAEIHTFIESLPEGYQTFLDNGEASLSGGQAQRISIARAFVSQPEFLILDECTSALDVESARLVRKTITNLKTTKSDYRPTILIITHKQEMMALADKIIVLENGHVVEQGDFNHLAALKTGKLYNILNAGVWE